MCRRKRARKHGKTWEAYYYRDATGKDIWLRNAPKIPKGTEKPERAEIKAVHARLPALGVEHCPARVSADDTWKAIGLDRETIWLSGGRFFELEGTVYPHLGFKLSANGNQVDSATEIMASELEAARQQVLQLRKAA